MTNPNPGKAIPNVPPLITVLNQLVIPAFEQEADPADGEPTFELREPEPDSDDAPHVIGCLHNEHVVQVDAEALDETHTTLRFSLSAGYLLADCGTDAFIIGNLLESTPFHIHCDYEMGVTGRLTVGCDLVVRSDDAPLVRRRLGELHQLANDFDWYFPLRRPKRLRWRDVHDLEIDWKDLPHGDLNGFLDDGLKTPPEERLPLTLLCLAQGLDRWQDVLRLLREHTDEFPSRRWAPLKCMACRQLDRWRPAIRAAKEGGIRNGRYPGTKQLSPSYVHALIEGGDEIEALRVLGKPFTCEPGFYSWLRGLALRRSGDFEQAEAEFSRYFSKWPGDVLGVIASEMNAPEEE